MTREEAIKMLKSKMDGHTDTSYEWAETVRMAIKALEKESKTQQFAEWVAEEIFSELWEVNYDGFAEIACRKLAKLGLVKATKNKWIYEKSQEWKQVQTHCTDAISRQAALDCLKATKLKKFDFILQAREEIKNLPPASTEKKNVEIVKFDTPYTDEISRQAAIDAMREETCLSCWDAKDILEHLPSISTEKTGYWIKIKPYPLQMHDYECSECKHETDDNTEKYCSGCGCRMLGVKE